MGEVGAPVLPPTLFTALDESKVSVTPVEPLFTPDTKAADAKGVEEAGRFDTTLYRSRLPKRGAPPPD